MSFELAIRSTEILLALSFIQQSVEHLCGQRDEKILFIQRFILSILLLLGIQTQWVCLLLIVLALFILKRFQGPYNGGSDRMGLLILCCLCLIHVVPSAEWQERIFAYLALQLILSYFISGWVKIINPDWRSGLALQDVFQFSTYPVSEGLRELSKQRYLLWMMSWAAMLFELLFPTFLLSKETLIYGLIIGALFHFANACLFGLNRFFWVWIAAYPSVLWFQYRIFAPSL